MISLHIVSEFKDTLMTNINFARALDQNFKMLKHSFCKEWCLLKARKLQIPVVIGAASEKKRNLDPGGILCSVYNS